MSKSVTFCPSVLDSAISGSSLGEPSPDGGGGGGGPGPSGLRMDPELARRLFETGANLVLLDFPVGTEFGIDMNVWNTGERFRGVKMIPPGIHFVFYSAVSKEGQTAPRTGFFHDFTREELVVRRYNPRDEDVEEISDEEKQRIKADLLNLEKNLGAYPYDSWKKWISLTNRISPATISRLEPMSGKIQSVTELIPEKHFTSRRAVQDEPMPETTTSDQPGTSSESPRTGSKRRTETQREEEKLPKMNHKPGTEIRYTPLPTEKYPAGSTPAEVTMHSMDSSYQLETYLSNFIGNMYGDQVSTAMAHLNQTDEVLAELQFCFICFLVGQHYDSFEHWKKLLSLLCLCDEAISKLTDLYLILITDLHFQIREVPDDFFVDIVSSNNFLVTILTHLFATIKANDKIDPRLKDRALKFKANLSRKFNWDFDQDLEEDEPVIVDLDEAM